MDLILASTSPYRRDLLGRLGVPFRCVDPRVDEDVFKVQGLAPEALALTLAREKARAIQANEPESVVIGGDQLVECRGEILGKPGTRDRAVDQLLRLAGSDHHLITAVAVSDASSVRVHADVATLRMRRLGRAEAERYVVADSPLDCAGSYKIESLGISLFERIESEDFTAIVGLPLLALATMLRGLGWEIP